MPPVVFVVIPAYNEGQVLASTLQPLIERRYQVVVVDDCSSDQTWAVASAMPVHVLRHPINLGQGAALQTGMTYALQCGADFVVHYDADGQHRPEDIENLLQPLRDGVADVALGSRFLRESDRLQVPPLRRLVLRAAVVFNGLLTRLWLTDAHNGFRALTAQAARQIYLRENRSAHASEILSLIRRHQLRYVEVPTSILYTDYSRAKGQSFWSAPGIAMDFLLSRLFR